MKSVYERENLSITEFNTEDVIVTSGETPTPEQPVTTLKRELENRYFTFSSLNDPPGDWF